MTLTLHRQSGRRCVCAMSVLSKAHVGSLVLKLDSSDKQPTVVSTACVVSDLVLSTVCCHVLCAADRPNGCVAAICTDKVPGQGVDRLGQCMAVKGDVHIIHHSLAHWRYGNSGETCEVDIRDKRSSEFK